MTDRNIARHKLYDHMHDLQCPICEQLDAGTAKGMENLLYEGINDLDTRKRLYHARSFCARHAHRLAQMGDPLAHAILYSDFIALAMETIETAPRKVNSLNQTNENCLFCVREKEAEAIYVSAFIEAYAEADFSGRYAAGGRLCIPHLALVMHLGGRKTEAIVKATLEKYRTLVGHLSEIKRKNDYRFKDEEWTPEEKAAWQAAVDTMNGKEGTR